MSTTVTFVGGPRNGSRMDLSVPPATTEIRFGGPGTYLVRGDLALWRPDGGLGPVRAGGVARTRDAREIPGLVATIVEHVLNMRHDGGLTHVHPLSVRVAVMPDIDAAPFGIQATGWFVDEGRG